MDDTDVYQERYLAHQARKREVLRELLAERHSHRVFAERPVSDALVAELLSAAGQAPSSCDRRAISIRQAIVRPELELLGGLLVGGVGWIHRAPLVLLLWADPVAYKAPGEIERMPYLDAGVVIENLYLAATAAGLKCCYVNPAVRPQWKRLFDQAFNHGANHLIFCGAFAVGHQ